MSLNTLCRVGSFASHGRTLGKLVEHDLPLGP